MSNAIRILFVDDEENLLHALRRLLRSMREEWQMTFAVSAAEAIRILSKERHDVIVSDLRMPGMDGAQLLSHIKHHHPHMVRIALSGYSDRNMTVRSVNSAHQYIAKPCEIETITSTVRRAIRLRNLLADEGLQSLVARIDSLPAAPAIHVELSNLLDTTRWDMRDVARIVRKDPALAARLLQVVNSSFFGLRRNIIGIEDAVTMLGVDLIKALIATIHLQGIGAALPTELAGLWPHCLRTAVGAKAIMAQWGGAVQQTETAFTAGLLHDTGKLLLAAGLRDTYNGVIRQAIARGEPLINVERAQLRATHAELAAYLLGLWGLPDAIVEAVAYHHTPCDCVHALRSPLTAVHLADAFDHLEHHSSHPSLDSGKLDDAYLIRQGLTDEIAGLLAAWRQTVGKGETA